MNEIFSRIKVGGRQVATVVAFVVIAAVAQMAIPSMLGAMIDKGVGDGRTGLVVGIAIAMAVLSVVACAVNIAAARLAAASDECVRRGYRLKVYDAYRPQRAVSHFMRWAKDVDDTRMKAPFYPNLDKSVLFEQGYIAEKSGHSRGSTVDLTLFDTKTGKEVDMGGTFDWFGEESHPDYKGVTEEQLANRMLLRDIMVSNGFKPLVEEWWHFTLADEPYPDTYFDFPVR